MIASGRYLRRVEGGMRKTIQKYSMIAPGDRVLVGLSGGKDSLVLLAGLKDLSEYLPLGFSVAAVTLDMRFGGVDGDFAALERFCEEHDIKYRIVRADIAQLLFGTGSKKNACFRCASVRRAVLVNAAKELGCSCVALGHNADDAAQTVLMNLLGNGEFSCFEPVTYYPDSGVQIIRPLVYERERDVVSAAKEARLPVIESRCPNDGTSLRA
ncbi:MAG: tRNA 2-thiocytidine biosynthesis TtcA family protein, partial [Clostridia bacterium]|nr:tRNA 2-thiocytidine biosynthesis TtcA family protein [Clostridia bacterium]